MPRRKTKGGGRDKKSRKKKKRSSRFPIIAKARNVPRWHSGKRSPASHGARLLRRCQVGRVPGGRARSRPGHLPRAHEAPAGPDCALFETVAVVSGRPRGPRTRGAPAGRACKPGPRGWKGLSKGGVPLGPRCRRPLSPNAPHRGAEERAF